MRNLKRALSLTLASIMLLGMMVVGSSAAGFPDVTEENNVEAIEVLKAVEVMVGDDNGNFGPNDLVNRSQMAVVMAKLLNLDYKYYEASCPFWDVPTWARGYVGACYAKGIASGYGDGTFGAADNVTAVQAASMMMRALGYFQYAEDYKPGFEIATVSKGTDIGIFKGLTAKSNEALTRNDVAQMALNALESEMVSFAGTPGTTYTASSGETLSIGYVAKYEPRTSTEIKYQAIEKRTSDVSGGNNLNRGQYYIQLGEELFDGKLTKRYARDDFERPSINWQYKGKDIGTYVDYDLLVAGGSYTKAVKFSELYDLLTYTTINENNVLRFEDGVDVDITRSQFARSNKDEVGGTGALTEVFLDQERDEIIITTINTYLAKANSDYNKTNDSLSLKVYAKDEKGLTQIVDGDEVPEVVDVKKDEYKLVYMSGKDSAKKLDDYVNYDVVAIFDTEIMSAAEITKWSKNDTKVVGKLTTGGTEYDTNRKAYYDHGNVLDDYDNQLLTDMTYNIYMDRYGNVIGVDLHEGNLNYVFITGYDRGKSNISIKTADAAAIFTDGTMDTITVNVSDTNKNIRSAKASTKEPDAYREYDEWTLNAGGNQANGGDRNLNRWYTYTKSANGNYTLKPVKNFMFTAYGDSAFNNDDKTKILDCANLFLDDSSEINKLPDNASKGRVYGEDDSIYITVDTSYVDTSGTDVEGGKFDDNDAITEVQGVYTGAQDIKIELSKDSKGLVNNDKDKNNELKYAQESKAEKDAYVYTVFDSNGYIIASIVMGDAQGASANYVYVLDGAKNERVERAGSSRAANADTYYWEFEAVVDGVKTTLTVKEKYSSTLKGFVDANRIVELRFDGDYVVDIKNVAEKEIFYSWIDGGKLTWSGEIEDKDIYDVGNRYAPKEGWEKDTRDWRGVGQVHNTSLVGKDGKLVDNGAKIARVEGDIYLQGRTLYVKNSADEDVGLALVRDAKAVLVQPENGKVESTNCDSVQEAIDRLSDRDPDTKGTQFKGRIAAVLDGRGVAKWVVIISDTNLLTGNNPNYNDKWSNGIVNGNITTYVRGVNNYNASSNIGRDDILYTTLDRIDDAKGNSKAETDMFEIEVYVNGRYMGDSVWNDANKRTVRYAFDDDRISYNSTTEIDVYVTPKKASSEDVAVTEVTLDKTAVTVTEGKTVALNATVKPSNATDDSIIWTSSNKTIATVSSTGVVTGVKAGTATITATAHNGVKAECAVTVTAEVPEGSVAVKPVTGSYVTTLDAQSTMITSAKKGDVIVAWPAQAVEITKGATDNGNNSYTVTGDEPVVVSVKKDANGDELWSYSEDQKAWAGGETGIRFISMANSPLYAKARMARAAVTGNWLDEALSNPDKTYTLTVTSGNNTYTWTGATTSSGVIGEMPVFALTPDANSNTSAARNAFLAAWRGGENAPDLKVEEGGEVKTSETIKAEISSNNINIYAYDVENDRPTEDEVKAAIVAELKKTNTSVTVADVTINGTKVTVKGEVRDYTLNPEYKALYKVTVNNEAAQYVKTGGNVTVKDEKITNLLASDKKTAANTAATQTVDPDKHTFEFTGKKDTVYKTALKLAAAITKPDGDTGSYSLQYNDGTKAAESWKNLTDSYIQAGVGIAVVGTGVSGEIAATVNKVEGKATAVANTVVIKFLDGVTAYAKNDDGKDETEIKIAIGGMTYTVNWNGAALTSGTKTKWAVGDKITLTASQLSGYEGAKYIVGKSKTANTADVPLTTDANGTSFTLSSAIAAKAKDGVIDIYPAFEIKSYTGSVLTLTDKTTGKNAIDLTTAKLVAANTKLVATAATANTLIGAKDNNTDKWTDADLTLVTKPMANKTSGQIGMAVYEVTLTKDIDAANDFEVNKKALVPSGGVGDSTEITLGTAKGVTDDTAEWTLVTGTAYEIDNDFGGGAGSHANGLAKADYVNLGKGTELKVRWDTGTSSELLKVDVTAKVTDEATNGQDTITFTAKSVSGTAKVAVAGADLTGTLIVTVGDEFQFPVKVKVAEPTGSVTASAGATEKKIVRGDSTEVKVDVDTHSPASTVTAGYSWTVDGKSVEGSEHDLVVSTLGLDVGVHNVVCYVTETDKTTGATPYAKKVNFKVAVFPAAEDITPKTVTIALTNATPQVATPVTIVGLPATGFSVAAASTGETSDGGVMGVASGTSPAVDVTPVAAGTATAKVTVTATGTSLTQDYTFTVTVTAAPARSTPTLSATSEIVVNSVGGTVTVVSDTAFDKTEAVKTDSWTINAGTTDLSLSSAALDAGDSTGKTVTLTFTGTAVAGDLKIKAKAVAFGQVETVGDSEEETFTVKTGG